MEWLKRRLRGTLLHRILRSRSPRRPSGPASALGQQNANYDLQTVEVMRRLLRPDTHCVDIGAHKGDILQHIVRFAPTGAHHAFEALPHLAKELRARFPTVKVHQQAVGDANGQAEFQHVENDPAYSGLRRRIYDRPDPKIMPICVSVVTLDSVIPASQAIGFMKIDIEGGEYHALKGAVDTVRRGKPVIVLEAGSKSTGQYGVTPAAMYHLITQELGYELSTMRRWLDRVAALTLVEFCHNWDNGPDYYFIATPSGLLAEPGPTPDSGRLWVSGAS